MSSTYPDLCPIDLNGRGTARIDAADRSLVAGRKWYLTKNGYASAAGGRELLHRVIMGAAKGDVVDHVNGDRLDCRRANLRLVTTSLNALNRHAADSRSISGLPGIGQRGKRWVVYIFQGKRHYVGSAGSLLDAIKLRAEAEVKHFGEMTPVIREALANQGGQ